MRKESLLGSSRKTHNFGGFGRDIILFGWAKHARSRRESVVQENAGVINGTTSTSPKFQADEENQNEIVLGIHADNISIVSIEGITHIFKHFDVHLLTPKQRLAVCDNYLRYRQQVSDVFAIPDLYELKIDSPSESVTANEEYIHGITGTSIVQSGDVALIEQFAESVFLPLKSCLLSKDKIKKEFGSLFQLDRTFLFNPAHFVARDGIMYYIDFYPPRLREDGNGKIYPQFPGLENSDKKGGDIFLRMTRKYSDIVELAKDFALRIYKINPKIEKETVGEIMKNVLHTFDSSQELFRYLRSSLMVYDPNGWCTKEQWDTLRKIFSLEELSQIQK